MNKNKEKEAFFVIVGTLLMVFIFVTISTFAFIHVTKEETEQESKKHQKNDFEVYVGDSIAKGFHFGGFLDEDTLLIVKHENNRLFNFNKGSLLHLKEADKTFKIINFDIKENTIKIKEIINKEEE